MLHRLFIAAATEVRFSSRACSQCCHGPDVEREAGGRRDRGKGRKRKKGRERERKG
jgi:hypothetical protein